MNKSTKLFLDSKTAELSLYFPDDVDEEDKIENSEALNKIAGELSEDLISFLFLLKISKKIEISVQLPTEKYRFNKVIYFPLVPQTMYLEKKTRTDFF